MNDGRKVDLDLGSMGIDVKSSDMLVPLSAPKLAHNRQRWQGHVLPTSLRYERNGWAAGWYVYEFEFEEGYVFSSDRKYALTRVQVNNNPTYMVKLHQVMEYNEDSPQESRVADKTLASAIQNTRWYVESRDVADLSFLNTTAIETSTYIAANFKFNGKSGTVAMTSSPSGLSVVSTTPSIISVYSVDASALGTDGTVKVTVADAQEKINVNITLSLPHSVINNDPVSGKQYEFAVFKNMSDVDGYNGDARHFASAHYESKLYDIDHIAFRKVSIFDKDGTSLGTSGYNAIQGFNVYNKRFTAQYEVNYDLSLNTQVFKGLLYIDTNYSTYGMFFVDGADITQNHCSVFTSYGGNEYLAFQDHIGYMLFLKSDGTSSLTNVYPLTFGVDFYTACSVEVNVNDSASTSFTYNEPSDGAGQFLCRVYGELACETGQVYDDVLCYMYLVPDSGTHDNDNNVTSFNGNINVYNGYRNPSALRVMEPGGYVNDTQWNNKAVNVATAECSLLTFRARETSARPATTIKYGIQFGSGWNNPSSTGSVEKKYIFVPHKFFSKSAKDVAGQQTINVPVPVPISGSTLASLDAMGNRVGIKVLLAFYIRNASGGYDYAFGESKTTYYNKVTKRFNYMTYSGVQGEISSNAVTFDIRDVTYKTYKYELTPMSAVTGKKQRFYLLYSDMANVTFEYGSPTGVYFNDLSPLCTHTAPEVDNWSLYMEGSTPMKRFRNTALLFMPDSDNNLVYCPVRVSVNQGAVTEMYYYRNASIRIGSLLSKGTGSESLLLREVEACGLIKGNKSDDAVQAKFTDSGIAVTMFPKIRAYYNVEFNDDQSIDAFFDLKPESFVVQSSCDYSYDDYCYPIDIKDYNSGYYGSAKIDFGYYNKFITKRQSRQHQHMYGYTMLYNQLPKIEIQSVVTNDDASDDGVTRYNEFTGKVDVQFKFVNNTNFSGMYYLKQSDDVNASVITVDGLSKGVAYIPLTGGTFNADTDKVQPVTLSFRYVGLSIVRSISISLEPADYEVNNYFFEFTLPEMLKKSRGSAANDVVITPTMLPSYSTIATYFSSAAQALTMTLREQNADSTYTNIRITSLYRRYRDGRLVSGSSTLPVGTVLYDNSSSNDKFINSVTYDGESDNVIKLTRKFSVPYMLIFHEMLATSSSAHPLEPLPYTAADGNKLNVVIDSKTTYHYTVSAGQVTVDYALSSSTFKTYDIYEFAANYKRTTIANLDYFYMFQQFTQDITGDITVTPLGFFDLNSFYATHSVTLNGFTYDTLRLSVNDTGYSFDVSLFSGLRKWLNVYSVDVRADDPDDTKLISRIECQKEKQVLRQFWDTDTGTENFWWIDRDTVMKLTDDSIILYDKDADSYDDWQADTWHVSTYTYNNTTHKAILPRTDYLNTSVKRWIVTNAYGEGSHAFARLVTFTLTGKTTFTITVYNPHDIREYGMTSVSYKIELQRRNLGQALVSGGFFGTTPSGLQLSSYSNIDAAILLSEAKITATTEEGYIAIGIHYDNNFNQWAILLDGDTQSTSTNWRIIQGYGYVGVDGSLTGGQIPEKYFSATNGGFVGTVEPLSSLSTGDVVVKDLVNIDTFDDRIVGNEDRQWYLGKRITGIVSHLRCKSLSGAGSFTVNVLPLTNSYSSIYASPSFVIRKSGDISVSLKSLADLFPSQESTAQAIWKAMMVAIGYPMLCYINPKITTINYLQQTLGQYAYVHYNSTAIRKQVDAVQTNDANAVTLGQNGDVDTVHLSPVDSDDLSFDVMHIPQEQDIGPNPWHTLFYAIGAAGLNALEYGIEKLQVNMHIAQQTTQNKGVQFSQMFQKNVESMTSAEFTVQSVTPVNKSEVTAVKTLDMFYSTSSDQHVEAGPGFVVHNFVAQCVAQSVTSVQLESQQITMMYVIKAITMFQFNLVHKATQLLIDFMRDKAEALGGTPFFLAGLASGSSFGWPAALVLDAVQMSLKTIQLAADVASDSMDALLDAVGASSLKTTVTAKQSKHTYDVEGKHRYGSKHETFMWPCINENQLRYKDEYVVADTQSKPWSVSLSPYADGLLHTGIGETMVNKQPATATIQPSDGILDSCIGEIDYRIASCYGKNDAKALPDDMAMIVGAESFLSPEPFKNENISESEPVFPSPVIQDFVISKQYELYMTCTAGEIAWVSCRDTKLIDGAPSNIVYSKGFCGVASTYCALEIRQGIEKAYLRPWAVTPDALAINTTGLNCFYDQQAYHAFDGVGYRITDWVGAPGMNKEHYVLQYAFQVNDRFKRSNKLPPNQFLGNFTFDPSMAAETYDPIYSIVTIPGEGKGLEAGTVGEDKDVQRYSLPIFTEFVSTLPAVVKTAQPYKLAVVDGITSLTTDLRNTQVAYKTPVSNDFVIGTQLYRATQEYICRVDESKGAVVVTPLVPTLGMHYIGATPFEAFFYSQATRQYYSFAGGSDVRLVDMMERFRDIVSGRWDFVNQMVLMPCLATFDRLDQLVKDDNDETDNIMILGLRDTDVRYELTPPNKAIFKALPKGGYDKSFNADQTTDMGFRLLSMPSGVVYQGPNRCIINRYTWSEYMLAQIKANKGRWKKVPREVYHPFREYYQNYNSVSEYIDHGVKGWTHNPFLLVTAPLGINEETDCKFEWEITFAWTVEMDKLYEADEYVCVNICSELMSPGGKVVERPTHVFLTKELFTRTGNYGYYSFRYQGNGGAGNRERLHIWSDGYIAVSSVQVEYKVMTEKRTEILTQAVDVQALKEF